MLNKYKLSICIPTYNREKYLVGLMSSILKQVDKKHPIEICISDNCSTDNTENLIAEYKKKYQNIVYFRQPANMGFDKNILKATEISNGEYCWLMGSDDKIEDGAIDCIMQTLTDYDGISGITVNANTYSSDMQRKFLRPSIVDVFFKDDQLFRDNANHIFSTLGYYLAYISAQIIKKELWNKAVPEENVIKECKGYIHLYIIGKMLQIRPFWLYLSHKLVGGRSGNDAFLVNGGAGIINRIKLDAISLTAVLKNLFGLQAKIYNDFMQRVLSTCTRGQVLGAKLQGKGYEAFKLTVNHFWCLPTFWIKIFPIFIIPKWALLIARYIYRAGFKEWLSKKIEPV